MKDGQNSTSYLEIKVICLSDNANSPIHRHCSFAATVSNGNSGDEGMGLVMYLSGSRYFISCRTSGTRALGSVARVKLKNCFIPSSFVMLTFKDSTVSHALFVRPSESLSCQRIYIASFPVVAPWRSSRSSHRHVNERL